VKRFLLEILAVAIIALSTAPNSGVALQACNALPFSAQSEHVLFGRPVLLVNEADAPQTIDLVFREIFELRNNGDNKFADWVGYYLDGSTFGAAGQPNYGNDLCINSSRTLEADPSDADDYANANNLGLERAHLADPVSFGNSPNRFDLDLYSNIVPMHEALVPAWKEFEAVVRAYITRENQPLYVLTGTEYKYEMPNLPGADEDHNVPSGFWKFVLYEGDTTPNEDGFATEHKIEYAGIWFDQSGCLSGDDTLVSACEEDHEDWRDRPIRFVDIEGFTRFDFNTDLPNDEEYPNERRHVFNQIDLEEESEE